MSKIKKIIIAVGIILVVIVGGILFLNYYLKQEVVKGLENEYPASVLSYDEISINVLARSATIKNLRLKDGKFLLKTPEVSLKGFSYTDYLRNEDITIGSVHLVDPEVVINKSDSIADASGQDDIGERKIRVENFTASGGSFKMIENDTSSSTLFASFQDMSIRDILINEKEVEGLLPFHYESMSIKSDSIYYDMNATHFMQAKLFNFNNDDLTLEELSIIPKYSKVEFDRRIPYEQDWIALKIDAVKF